MLVVHFDGKILRDIEEDTRQTITVNRLNSGLVTDTDL